MNITRQIYIFGDTLDENMLLYQVECSVLKKNFPTFVIIAVYMRLDIVPFLSPTPFLLLITLYTFYYK